MVFDPQNYQMAVPFGPIGAGDLTDYYTTANVVKKFKPGMLAWTWDMLYGLRIFKLVKNLNGSALAAGNVVTYEDPVDIDTITAGSTTSITTSGLTANDLEYQLIQIEDDAGAAGAAPEGEISLCISNTATVITLHPDYPFSAAVAASDTGTCININAVDLSADSDKNAGVPGLTNGVCGVVMSAVPDNSWGWVCQRGIVTAKNTNAITVGEDLVAGTGTVVGHSNEGHEEIIGTALGPAFAGAEDLFVACYINVFDKTFHYGTP